MITLEFVVGKQSLTRIDNEKVVSNSTHIYKCHFAFSDEWNGKEKTATFTRDKITSTELLDSTDSCYIPSKLLKASNGTKLQMGVFGVGNNEIITSTVVEIPVQAGSSTSAALDEFGFNVYEQIMQRISEISQGQVSEQTIAQAVNDYLVEHPNVDVSQAISNYFSEHPIESVNVTTPYTNKKGIAFGTSITNLCSNYNNGGYIGVVKNKLGLSQYVNAGYVGFGIAKTTNSALYSIVYRVKNTSLTDYDLITIEGCTNDFGKNVPLGNVGVIGDTNFDESTFCGALRSAIEHVLTNNPQAKLLIITDPQRNYNQDNLGVNSTNSQGLKLIDYVNAMIQIAMLYGIPVCDWYRNSGINKFTKNTYTADGLHPNELGYERLGNLVVSSLLGNTVIIDISGQEEPSGEETKTLTSISATKTITTYQENDALATNDIVVTAHYSDNTTSNVTSSATINTSNVNMTTAGTYTISVSYTENGVTKTATITVTVTASGVTPTPKTLSNITATKTVTTYIEGETLATNDITVTANYSDGTNANVTSFANINSENVDMSTAGVYTISISYTENGVTKNTEIQISVSAESGVVNTNIATIGGVDYDISAASAYPYKAIINNNGALTLVACDYPFKIYKAKNQLACRKPAYKSTQTDGIFAALTSFTSGVDDGTWKSVPLGGSLDAFVWSNHDLYYTTGDLALEKSV